MAVPQSQKVFLIEQPLRAVGSLNKLEKHSDRFILLGESYRIDPPLKWKVSKSSHCHTFMSCPSVALQRQRMILPLIFKKYYTKAQLTIVSTIKYIREKIYQLIFRGPNYFRVNFLEQSYSSIPVPKPSQQLQFTFQMTQGGKEEERSFGLYAGRKLSWMLNNWIFI